MMTELLNLSSKYPLHRLGPDCTFVHHRFSSFVMKNFSKSQLLVFALIAVGGLTRVLPHAPNFTAVAAVALFGGALVKSRTLALSIPLIALLLSDLIVNNILYPQYFNGFTLFYPGMWAVYGSFILVTLMGRFFLNTSKPGSMVFMTITSSLLFFIVTNFQIWMSSGMYPNNAAGLSAAYIAALPFLGNMVLSTGIYLFVMDLVYKTAVKRVTVGEIQQ